MPHWEILSGNRIDTKNVFLDRSWANEDRKIAPESIEYTDPEISSLLWSSFAIFSLAKLTSVSQCSGITLRAEGLYESFSVCST